MSHGFIRPEIAGATEYKLKQYSCRIKLNQNENPYELPIPIKTEILERVSGLLWSRYPPFVQEKQLDLLSRFVGWKKKGTLLGNGSNELLQLLFMCVLERGTSVVISQPTFTLYKLLGQSLAANVVEVPMTADFRFDVQRLIDATNKHQARMLVLCSPNNPTGTLLTRDEVRHIVSSTQALVVLDEAYVQFSRETQVALLNEFDRLVVLQTFSKAMGAAGLRCGYALMQPDLAVELNKVKLPYSVNIFTLTALEVLLTRWDEVKGWIGDIVRERDRLFRELSGIQRVRVYSSEANFLLFESLQKSPELVFQSVLDKGILIRNVSTYPGLQRGLRVSVGTPDENTAFLTALKEALT